MAGASYIQNTFVPISYEEMVRPLLMQQEVHNKIQEQESDLQALSSQWEDKLNNEKDAALKQKYSAYLQDIKAKADQLASTGLTGASKQGLYDLKTGYTTNIKPIEDAYKIRQERADEQRKLQMTDPSMFVDRNLGEEALSSFIANPNLSARNYSGAMIEKQVATAVAPFAQKFATNPRLQHENPQYFKYIQHYGASVGTIKALKDGVIQGPMAQAIKNEIDAVMESTGMTKWDNYDSIKKRALGYAYQGASAAIGKDDINFLQDRSYMDDLQKAQLGQYNVQKDKTNYAGALSDYDANSGEGKELSDTFNKLFTKEGFGRADVFGKTGKQNPFISLKNNTVELNSVKKQLADLYKEQNSGDIFNLDLNKTKARSTQIQDLLSKKNQLEKGINTNQGYIDILTKAGITEKDNYKTTREKLLDYKDTQSKSYTSYDLQMQPKAMEVFGDKLIGDLRVGRAKVYPIEDGVVQTDKPIDAEELLDNKKSTGNMIDKLKSSPRHQGLVIESNGKQYKLESFGDRGITEASQRKYRPTAYSIEFSKPSVDKSKVRYFIDNAGNENIGDLITIGHNMNLPKKLRQEALDLADYYSSTGLNAERSYIGGYLETSRPEETNSQPITNIFKQ